MTSSLFDSLEEELNSKLGNRPFYTLRELKSIGFFGSVCSARIALREGRIPFVKISPRRLVVPRLALLAYLRDHMSEAMR